MLKSKLIEKLAEIVILDSLGTCSSLIQETTQFNLPENPTVVNEVSCHAWVVVPGLASPMIKCHWDYLILHLFLHIYKHLLVPCSDDVLHSAIVHLGTVLSCLRQGSEQRTFYRLEWKGITDNKFYNLPLMRCLHFWTCNYPILEWLDRSGNTLLLELLGRWCFRWSFWPSIKVSHHLLLGSHASDNV